MSPSASLLIERHAMTDTPNSDEMKWAAARAAQGLAKTRQKIAEANQKTAEANQKSVAAGSLDWTKDLLTCRK
jgi:hypothetical protein